MRESVYPKVFQTTAVQTMPSPNDASSIAKTEMDKDPMPHDRVPIEFGENYFDSGGFKNLRLKILLVENYPSYKPDLAIRNCIVDYKRVVNDYKGRPLAENRIMLGKQDLQYTTKYLH